MALALDIPKVHTINILYNNKNNAPNIGSIEVDEEEKRHLPLAST